MASEKFDPCPFCGSGQVPVCLDAFRPLVPQGCQTCEELFSHAEHAMGYTIGNNMKHAVLAALDTCGRFEAGLNSAAEAIRRFAEAMERTGVRRGRTRWPKRMGRCGA